MKTFFLALIMCGLFASNGMAQTVLSKAQLRDIELLLGQLTDQSKELHAEFHEHLEGIPHGEKLETDAEEIEKTATELRTFVLGANGDMKSVTAIRSGTNHFIQHTFQISRTVELAAPWTRTDDQRRGIAHMREASQEVIQTAMRIEAFLPPNAFEVDGQAEQLEENIKELHSEFHEHLQGYEVSAHLDADLEEVERLVEHLHELCHDKTWQQIDMNHLSRDIQEIKSKTDHIESLFVQQSRIGVRTSDWIGIEHSRDAITDVLSAAYLLDFMIEKTNPRASVVPGGTRPGTHDHTRGRQRPKRDR